MAYVTLALDIEDGKVTGVHLDECTATTYDPEDCGQEFPIKESGLPDSFIRDLALTVLGRSDIIEDDNLVYPAKRDVKNVPDEDNEFEYPPSPKVKESDQFEYTEEPFDALMRVKREFMTAMERWTNMFELSEPERDELLDL
jgi:hypothetical protein